MNCAYCKYNDGMVYTSFPAKYKCSVTGGFHLALDDCNVDFEPVIRCKECVYSELWRPPLLWCIMFDIHTEGKGYCWKAKSKEINNAERK